MEQEGKQQSQAWTHLDPRVRVASSCLAEAFANQGERLS